MDEKKLTVGITGSAQMAVDKSNTAAAMRSGALEVFATPMMIALMEKASCDAVEPYLEEGQGTVGISVNVAHEAATPIGMTVTAKTELAEIDGRKLTFKVEAFDDSGRIGSGTHERFIIFNDKFQSKADAKKNGFIR